MRSVPTSCQIGPCLGCVARYLLPHKKGQRLGWPFIGTFGACVGLTLEGQVFLPFLFQGITVVIVGMKARTEVIEVLER